jgi:hypothetical protein
MTFDDDVRETLLAHADDAPEGAGTLEAVAAREHRIRTRQRLGTAGVAAVMAVAVAVTVPYVLASGRHPTGRTPVGAGTSASQPGPTKSAAPTYSTVPTHASRVPLEPATFTRTQFPMNPTFTPPGLPAPTVHRDAGPDVALVYSNTDDTGLVANVGQGKGPDFTPVTTEHTTINGHPATIYTGTEGQRPAVQINWRLGHGPYVYVSTVGPFTKAQVKQFAVGLQEGTPMPAPALPFQVALAPHAYQVAFEEIHPEYPVLEFHFCLAPQSHLGDEDNTWLCVAQTADSGTPTGGDPVQVGDDPGELVHSGNLILLNVFRPGFPFSVIEQDQDGPLSESDLINFAIGFTAP